MYGGGLTRSRRFAKNSGTIKLKDIEIKEGLNTKAYEISVLDQKNDELVKKSLLTKSQLEGYLKEKTKVISDLKDHFIWLAPKCSTYNGRPTFANPRYLKKAQSEKPYLYEIPYNTSDLAKRFAPNREETMTLANESRSKLNKDYVKPYDYIRHNSLYEIFKAPSLEYLYQLERAKEVRKTMWRKLFVRTKPNIAKNVMPVTSQIEEKNELEKNKTILKQLKKANASLTQELEECKTNLDEIVGLGGGLLVCRDSCLIALQNKHNELEKYIAFNNRTIDYEILQTKLNDTLGLLALKDIEIKEGLNTKAYEISVLDQKNDELVKKSLLTKSQLEGYLKEKTKVISDLKSIQTIHMLAPKCSTYNGRPTFANPRYLKKAQSEKPYLYEIPYNTSDLAKRFAPNREETMTLANESRSKLNKDV
ncbi:hypothetical protein Tco_0519617 [Tanacetum coccineum]